MRRLWRVVGAGFAVCALAVSALQVLGLLSLDSSIVRRSVPGDGVTTLVVQADQGSVEIVGGGSERVSVEARVRRSLVDADVEVRRDGGRVVVEGTCPGFSPGVCAVDLVVRAPSSLAVEVEGRDGDVAVRDVRSSVAISTVDGDVVATGIGGSLAVDVTDGDVLASGLADRAEVSTRNGAVGLSFATAPAAVSVDTGDGEVDVVVPDGPETYRVDATSGDGTVDTRVRTDPASGRTIVLRSGDGSLTVRYPA
ncbi:DUF4097 family beta strand repeat-containing protein [Dermatobacter hominis]|uniref:DUF4097 family beta strand repeat-containing protein n=1 Tax=Dermatobacter hominis TaxID=2884263 RepID=UPI001D129FC5|nr:DUF4097 family beta strand repeat-containing protein [Dermatobacter hominis]UDY38026.1 DUF4097 domain-containing protein [Dermatobacter hominis]